MKPLGQLRNPEIAAVTSQDIKELEGSVHHLAAIDFRFARMRRAFSLNDLLHQNTPGTEKFHPQIRLKRRFGELRLHRKSKPSGRPYQCTRFGIDRYCPTTWTGSISGWRRRDFSRMPNAPAWKQASDEKFQCRSQRPRGVSHFRNFLWQSECRPCK